VETKSTNWNERPGDVIKQFTQEPPVDVFGLARALGLEVLEAPLLNLSGMLVPDDPRSPSGYTIQVNSTDPFNRRRFTVAHEIAHFLLHRHRNNDGFKDDRMYRSPGATDAVEAEANRLAADIIMPRRIIRKLLDQGISDPKMMANMLQVSPDAMAIRLGLRSQFKSRAL